MVTGQLDDATIDLYADLARAQFDAQKSHLALVAAQADEVPQAVSQSLSQAQATEYKPAQTGFAGFFVQTVTTTFETGGVTYHFNGLGGGLAVGGGASWGAAWLNYDPASIVGWEFNFQCNNAGGTVNVNWWGMSGEYIGSYVGSGVGISVGITGGKGDITRG